MKTIHKTIVLAVATTLMAACRQENTSIVPLNEKPVAMSVQKTVGDFSNGDGETASGKASIYAKDKAYQLVFEELMVNNGPNLHVYLSQETNPKNFVDLGDLKSIKGSQVYDIPAGVDAPSYKYALVYCKQYSHLFGYATLK
jgi:hypothetical protein